MLAKNHLQCVGRHCDDWCLINTVYATREEILPRKMQKVKKSVAIDCQVKMYSLN